MMKTELVIVGGGAAGLAAGAAAAAHGVRTVILDEAPVPGGRLRGQLHEQPGAGGRLEWRRGGLEADQLLSDAKAAGVEILSSTIVWALSPGWRISRVHSGVEEQDLEAGIVILATGTMQRSLAMHGWTLPGVLAVGAVQSMVNQYRIRPGKRALVIGVDMLSLTVARQLALAGVDVAGVVLPPPGDLSGARAEPVAVLTELLRFTPWAPSAWLRLGGQLIAKGGSARLAATVYPRQGVRVWGVPVFARRAALVINGTTAVESVLLADLTSEGRVVTGSERTEQVDFVCLSGGLSPLAELALQAGCRTVYMEELGGYLPLHGPDLQTTISGLLVAGGASGVEGASVAVAQGRLAGTKAAALLERLPTRDADRLLSNALTEVEAARKGSPLQFHPKAAVARGRLGAMWKESGGTHNQQRSNAEVSP